MKPVLSVLFVLISFVATAQTKQDYYKKAKDFEDQKKYESALVEINKAMQLDSANLDYYDVKGFCLLELKQLQDAYDVYDKASSLFPDKSWLYSQKGNILLTVSEFDAAIKEFSNAVYRAANDSQKVWALTNRAAAEIMKRDFTGAYNDLKAAYKIDSNDMSVLVNLGAVCDDAGKGDETLDYLFRANRIDPKYNPVYGNIGFKYQEMGDYRKAIEYFNRSLELDPNDGQTYGNRGYNKLKLKDVEGAMSDVNKSIQLYSANSYAYRIRALIYIEKKDLDKACADLQTAIDKGFTAIYGNEVIELQKKYCGK